MDRSFAMKQLLIIDDDPSCSDLVRHAILDVDTQIDVHTFENAVQAFSFLRCQWNEGRPDLIVVDHHMPIFDGIMTLKLLLEIETLRSVPLVMWSALLTDADRRSALQAGASRVLAKPASWIGYVQLAKQLISLMPKRSAPGKRPTRESRRMASRHAVAGQS